MKPYPRYKTTGLAWLPYVPEHWEVKRLKNLFEERKEANREGKTTRVLSLLKDVGVIPYEDKGNIGNKSKEDITQYKIAHKGDLVLNSMNVIIGSVGVSKYDGCVSPVYYALRPRKGTNAKYYEHVMRLSNVQKVIRGRANGILEIRLRISAGALLDLPFPLPPPSEQDRIVRYLDAKTAAIDELVRAKEREIELLRERKQALVSAAVTGGLAPTMERKDSGIPWVGKIPKHWAVAKTGHLFKMLLGKMLANSATSPKDTFERYACAKDVHFSGIDTSDLKEMWFSPEEKALLQTRQGDLLIVEGGAGAGGAAIVEDDGGYCIQNSIHLLRSKHELGWTPFLKYWMFSLVSRGYIDHVCNKATIPHFTKDKVFNMPLPLPPLPEQRRIVEHLDNVCSELAAAEAAIRKQITLLQELRTRLVSDAVTGAVEVS